MTDVETSTETDPWGGLPSMPNIEMRPVRTLDASRYQYSAPMKPNEFQGLIESIHTEGFDSSTPIICDGAGHIICGHQRFLAALHLNLPTVPVIVRDGLSEDDKARLSLRDNAARRHHETVDERKLTARHLLRQFDGWSDRAIAGQTNLSPTVIGKLRLEVRAEQPQLSTVDSSATRVGLDGKVRRVPQRQRAAEKRQLSYDWLAQTLDSFEEHAVDPQVIRRAAHGLDRQRLFDRLHDFIRRLSDIADALEP